MFKILQHANSSLRYTPSRLILTVVLMLPLVILTSNASAKPKFQVVEATIEDIQKAIQKRDITTTESVLLYLQRIKAYNGTCVNEPQGILGPISTIPHAGKINALMTLNLRPDARKAWGFDERKARSMTDPVDNNPAIPDALEVAAALDAQFAETGKLVGPLHGIVFSIKDQYDTFDMRTTLGMDAAYANDPPPDDANFIKRLRDAGAIILAKANLGEGGSQRSRSSFGGTMCNPYDTTRSPGSSSGGSGSSVAANLVTCAIGEETGGSILHPARNANSSGLHRHKSWSARTVCLERGRAWPPPCVLLLLRLGVAQGIARTPGGFYRPFRMGPRDSVTLFLLRRRRLLLPADSCAHQQCADDSNTYL